MHQNSRIDFRSAALLIGLPLLAPVAFAGTPAFTLSSFQVPAQAHRLAAADLDGDGDRDLVVLSLGGQQSDLTVWRNIGNLTYTAGWSVALPAATGIVNPDLDLADLDGDGDVDIVLLVPGERAQVRLNGGPANPATFDTVRPIVVSGTHVQNAIGLIDGDLVPDLVTYSLNPGGEVVFRKGRGDGTFRPGIAALVGNDDPGSRIELGDWNGDGALDVTRAGSFGVETLAGQPALSVTGWGATTFHWFDVSTDVVVADLEGDSFIDIVVTIPFSGAIEVFHGNFGGAPLGPAPFPGGLSPHVLTTGDLDQDGILEVVVASAATDFVTILPGGAGGVYLDVAIPFSGIRGVSDLVAADLDGDGDLDLAASRLGGVVTLFENQLVP